MTTPPSRWTGSRLASARMPQIRQLWDLRRRRPDWGRRTSDCAPMRRMCARREYISREMFPWICRRWCRRWLAYCWQHCCRVLRTLCSVGSRRLLRIRIDCCDLYCTGSGTRRFIEKVMTSHMKMILSIQKYRICEHNQTFRINSLWLGTTNSCKLTIRVSELMIITQIYLATHADTPKSVRLTAHKITPQTGSWSTRRQPKLYCSVSIPICVDEKANANASHKLGPAASNKNVPPIPMHSVDWVDT